MAQSILDLILRTKKEGTGPEDAKRELRGLTDAADALKVPLAGAAVGLGALYAGLRLTVEPTVAYAKQVRDLGRTIGATAEQSSLLIQAADDVQVSTESLSLGLQAAIRKGVRPTIEGIGELADKYVAIQDPIARSKFLMDNFGRSGADLAPLMEKGSAGIREMGASARAAGLVMDEQAVRAARDYEIALDGLQDQLRGIQYALGRALIPWLARAADGFTNLIKVAELLYIKFQALTGQITWEEAAQRAATLAAQNYTAAAGAQAGTIDQVTAAQKGLADSGQDVARTAQEIARAVQDMHQQQRSWADSTAGAVISSLEQQGADLDHVRDAQIALDQILGTTTYTDALKAEHIGFINDAYAHGRMSLQDYKDELSRLIAVEREAQGIFIDNTVEIRHVGSPRAGGGRLEAGIPTLINESTLTRPEVIVPDFGGQVLTRQDAMAALGQARGAPVGGAGPGGEVTIINHNYLSGAMDLAMLAEGLRQLLR